jgi:hypothetical protein
MTGRHNRAAIYLRVSRDDQTTENQRFVLATLGMAYSRGRRWSASEARLCSGRSGRWTARWWREGRTLGRYVACYCAHDDNSRRGL